MVVFEGFRFSFYLYSEEQQSRIEGHVQVRIEKYFIIIFIGGLDILQSIRGIYDNIKYIETCSKVLLLRAIRNIKYKPLLKVHTYCSGGLS